MKELLKTIELKDVWVEAGKRGDGSTAGASLQVLCPACGTRYRLPPLMAGAPLKVRCFHCCKKFIVSVCSPC